MLEQIIRLSIKNKLIVILFTVSLAAFGLFAVTQIPIGAVPDITNNQVQVITTSGNLSTQDVEQFLTYPVELEMANLPGVKEIRSVSKFGLSVVTIVFEDKMGSYLPRQLIAEKIKSASANIPAEFGSPGMGPITTGLGEIYQYILDTKPGYENKYTAMDLRTVQDWIVKRQLSGIPGVVEINSWGGYLKQYEVAVNPEKLRAMNLSIIEVYDALNKNNSVAGGGYIEKTNQSYFVRGEGLVKSLDEIKEIVVKNVNGKPILIGDVGEVRFGHATRYGAITGNGQGEKVLGQIMMLKGGDSKKTIDLVKERVAEVQKLLPEGVYINPFLERSELISKTTNTVAENLILGCLIVIFVVVLLLGNIRSGLVISSVIPLSLLFALGMMYIFKIDANLMSLGAIDFGIIIDGAVIIVEFIAFQLTSRKNELVGKNEDEKQTVIDSITFDGASKMMTSAVFGQLIILIVFIPILSLSGVEGKMFRPMALTFSFALLGAMIFCFTYVPVAASIFLKPEKKEKPNFSDKLMALIQKSYDPVIRLALNYKKSVLGLALLFLVFSVVLFSRMGGEFVPTLDEGDFVIQPVLRTGTSLSKTIEMTTRIENILLKNFPEVEQVVSRIGAAEVPTDPMSMEETDIIIKLKPKKEWVSAKTKDELADKFKTALSEIPGIEYEFTQPIEMRFNELITGVRADVAIKIFGEDLDLLNQKALEIKDLISGVPGASDITVEKTTGLPQMSVKYDRKKLALYGLNVADLNQIVSMGFGGLAAGNVFEGEKRFDLVIRLSKDFRQNLQNLMNLYVDLPDGNKIPLQELATIQYSKGPAKISRDNTMRRVVVGINVRNRDLESVVKDIQAIVDSKVKLPPGYSISYGGQFENLKSAKDRLKLAVPVALLLIFIMLHFAFGSFKEALMVYSAIPLAAVGGILFLWMRGLPFSISAGVGFIALFGIAVLNGIVLIEHLKELKAHGIADLHERILTGTRQRLRPVMLTASAAALGFLPMAISTSAGAEVQRPLATVVIGGLVTSTLLTMIALPLLYFYFDRIQKITFFPFKIHKTTVLVLLLSLVGTSAFSQQKPVTADDLLKLALEHNTELKSLELQVERAKKQRGEAFNIDKTLLYYNYDKNNIAENGDPLKVWGINQMFQFPTIYAAQRKVFQTQMQMQSSLYELKKQDLSKQVLQSYCNLVYFSTQQKLLESLDTLYSQVGQAAKRKQDLGESNTLQTLTAQAKQNQIRTKVRQIREEIQAETQRLLSLIQVDTFLDFSQSIMPDLRADSVLPGNHPGLAYYELSKIRSASVLRQEKQKLLPDIQLEYFQGTNSGAGAKTYPGYQIGLAVPLFLSSQKAKIQTAKIEKEIVDNEQMNYRIHLESMFLQKKAKLEQYKAEIDYYHQIGQKLSEEIIRSAKKNYENGEIDLFIFIQSLENAKDIELNYLENLNLYNQTVLEINYLSI